MTKKNTGEKEKKRRQAYEHVLRSFDSASGLLIGSIHEIEDLQLDANRNSSEINILLNWMFESQQEIYEKAPELRPPRGRRKPRWEPESRSEYTRKSALWELWHHLRLTALILRESAPFAREIRLKSPHLDQQIGAIEGIQKAVFRDIWGEMSDREQRGWIREYDGDSEDGLIEPPPVERGAALERLAVKLETAAKVLDESAGLIAELGIGSERIRAIGYCLVTIFEIQEQIYSERPDLIPPLLREAYESKERSSKEEGEAKA